ncbi:uncharacterized protein HaLaN_02613, partial [Haematococcus lacustris]
MLVAVSYKKELMTTIYVAKELFFPAYADMALQLVSEAREMGFAHFLLISNTQAGCDELDGDTIIFRDPYVYLKRAPLAGISLLTSFESGPDTRNNNIGMVYAQNTRPDGPTAWVFRWLVEITL